MRKLIVIFCMATTSLHCYGKSNAWDKNFAKFAEKFTELQLKQVPFNCKPKVGSFLYFTGNPSREISLDEAKKYLKYSNKDFFITEYDYDMDNDLIFNIRQVENPPFADNKILTNNHIILIYSLSTARYLDECDTVIEVLNTFSFDGKSIDKIIIQGRYTREIDWKDVVFLSENTLRIFDYKLYFENFEIKNGGYYIIDKKKPQTVVEINDYKIEKNGKITHIKTHSKQYLKEFVSFYRDYQKNSDDPMNEYK